MSFKKNSKRGGSPDSVSGQHAFLSPSSYHWFKDTEDELRSRYFSKQQTVRGVREHAFAAEAIELKLPQLDNGSTLNLYINDAIGFRMEAEVPLFYTEDCFGTADALSCREEHWPDGIFMTLRVSDLKTGITPADMLQIDIYVAIFFLAYGKMFRPDQTRVVQRIYQNNQIFEHIPHHTEILTNMSRVRDAARQVAYFREED